MKSLKMIVAEVLLILAIITLATENFAQRILYIGELAFGAELQSNDERMYVTLRAKNGYTRWFTIPPSYKPPPRLPTSDYSYYSESFSCQNKIGLAYDAPDDNTLGNHAVAWGWYSIRIQVPSRDFDYTFDLDLRDANWVGFPTRNYYDTEIWYHTSVPHLTYKSEQGGISGTVGSSNTIWGWWGKNQNKMDLLVPVTATNNFSGGQIKMDETSYSTPKTLNWGWTTNHTIAAITPQNIGGKKYQFRKWSDGYVQTSRPLTIDDQHNSYSFTANFWNAYLSGPSYLNENQVGTFTAYPSGGTTPYNYTWYKMQLCGGVEPLGPPCDVWVQLPQFNGSQRATASGLAPGFKMRVEVTDAQGYLISVEKEVSVGGSLPKPLAPEKPDKEAPGRFTLFPNHPNPFNLETTIRYQLAEESRVSLSVYNLLGEEVKGLVAENQPAGVYEVQWNSKDRYGREVSSGIYIYRIEAVGLWGRVVQTRKMILMK